MKAHTLIDLLTEEQIIKLMIHLGSEEPRVVNNALAFSTICHNHSGGSHKLYYYHHSRTFRCYTDCSETFDVIGLVKKVRDCDYKEAIKYICSFFNIQDDFHYQRRVGFGDNIEEFADLSYLCKYDKPKVEEKKILTRYNENVLRIFNKNLFYSGWINEGISIKAMQKFGISYDTLNNRVIIPHRYVDNKLIGIKTRYIDNDDLKYVPLTHNGVVYRYPTGLNLYGLHLNWRAINRKRKVVIFEAEKSVLKAESLYGDNNFTVAICGSNLTKEHIDLLLKLDIEEVIIAVDKEFQSPEEALIYENKIRKVFVNKLLAYFNVSIMWDTENKLGYKDSPIDRTKEIFEELFEKRITIKE